MTTESYLPQLRRVLLQRQRTMHAQRRIDQSVVVTAIRDELGPLGDHPCIPFIVHNRWPDATIDGPNPDPHSDPSAPFDWIIQAARSCKATIRQYPWALDSSPDAKSTSAESLASIARLIWDVRKLVGVER